MFKESVSILLANISKAKLPGGIELETHQNLRNDQSDKKVSVPEDSIEKIEGLPTSLNQQQKSEVESLLKSHIANTYLWEYRYLNFYFVKGTQLVLDWLITLNQATTVTHFDSIWMHTIPNANERLAIITSLQNHHLINLDEVSGAIIVNPKGNEYQQWRGVLPQLTS